MDTLSLFTKFYAVQRNYRGIPFWLFMPLKRLTRYLANQILPRYLDKPCPIKGRLEKNLLVSFTSFPARINEVWMVVECLKRQSVLPEKIILWLSNVQFPTKESIPQKLWKEEDDLFEIRLVDGDIRSHKKYFYAMKEFPEKTIVTCDDDIFYHPETLEQLVKASRMYKGSVIANECRQLAYNSKEELLPYSHWKRIYEVYSCDNIVQIGVGGVLYPPQSLDETVLQKDLFIALCPLADDLWLNYMVRMKGTCIIKSALNMLPLPIKSNAPTLTSVNCGNNMNDKQINNLRQYFKKHGMRDVYSNVIL